jgi:hypothetical protein
MYLVCKSTVGDERVTLVPEDKQMRTSLIRDGSVNKNGLLLDTLKLVSKIISDPASLLTKMSVRKPNAELSKCKIR